MIYSINYYEGFGSGEDQYFIIDSDDTDPEVS